MKITFDCQKNDEIKKLMMYQDIKNVIFMIIDFFCEFLKINL